MTTEKQLWVGYYQLTYLNQPNTLYFGHLIGFAENRDIFQQRIEDYKTHYQCKLSLHKPNRNGSVVGISIRPSLFALSIPLRKYIIICVNFSISIKKRRRNGTFSDSMTHRYWWLICIILNMTQRA